ncbi:putative outer membrane protein [Pedobacter sp. BAL39]|uniref:SusC/RagA family TonB-linked outer membrane protein n=1 Tax=Pedobacter sp. BAL39 TaxID=391596 RepID=UPI0001559B12|nr:SusC/RagA family TonB-linked outer membrane protein [Pedobacter sp. BAL39]EDM36273.1 putative outer membrane protein [Pedobacter sp. BAL39]
MKINGKPLGGHTMTLPGKQYLRVMKLTMLLMSFCLLQVSAITKAQVYLTTKGEPLQKVLKSVSKQSGYYFVYTTADLKDLKTGTINLKNASIEAALKACFEGQPLIYEIADKTVMIKKKEKSLIDKVADFFQAIDVRGKVRDEQGQPLPGASIKVKDGTQTATTNTDGEFTLRNVDPGATLVISFIGFQPVELRASEVKGTITMRAVNNALTEVTVTSGYQSILKERATGAFDQVGQDVLANRPVSNPSTALQGLVAGMQGKENADGSVSFLIRGSSSMYGERAPLLVVDGFPLANNDFSTINPNDIESVTVLKDAAAASIWGARAANGVIVIATKRSKSGKNGLTVNASAFTRISERTNVNDLVPIATSAEQINLERMAFQNRWVFRETAGSFPDDLTKPLTLGQELLYANKNGTLSTAAMNAGLDSLSRINNQGQIGDLLLRRAVLSQYNVDFSMLGDKSKSYASLLFEDNKTRYQGSGYKRYGLNFSNEYKFTDFLTFNFGLYLQYKEQTTSGATPTELRNLSPYETLLKPDGNYAVNLNTYNREVLSGLPLNDFPYADLSYNLLREVRGRNFKSQDYNARIQAGFNVRIIPGLNFDTKLQYERGKTDNENYYSDDTFYVRSMVDENVEYFSDTRTIGRQFVPKGGIAQNSNANAASYVFRNQLTLVKDFGTKHSINAIAGMEISQYRRDTRANPWLYGYYPGKLETTLPPYGYGSSAAPLLDIYGYDTELQGGSALLGYGLDRFVSYYSNAAYTYDRKYTISGSVRTDASNFITRTPSLRWAPLWSVGGLWNIKAEGFAENISWLDRLSLRVTHGRNGNVEKTTSTNTLLKVSTSPNLATGTITALISDNGNPTLRWEKTTTTNLGIDYVLFKGKVFGKLDLYNKKGTDITGVIALPAAAGSTSQKFNNAGITNRGIELELGTQLKLPGIPVTYTTSLNYAYNKNIVNDLYYPALNAAQMLDIPNAFVEGRPINPVYSLTYAGTIAGVPQVSGPNGQPSTFNSYTLLSGVGSRFLNYEGTAIPPHTAGWYNTFGYRNFSLSVLLIGKFGGVYRNDIYNYNFAYVGSRKTIANRYISDVYAGRTDIPPFPNPNESNIYLWNQYLPYLSGLVERSSYIECKEIMLNYTLPATMIEKTKLRNVKVFAQLRDLGMVWTANKKGYNPDWLPGTERPLTTCTFGLNIGF